MPLVRRQVDPTLLCQANPAAAVRSELGGMTNHALANVMRQLSALSSYADDIFTELAAEAREFNSKTVQLQERVSRLQSKIHQLDPGVEEVSLQDIMQRKHFRNSSAPQQQLIAVDTRPWSVNDLLQACDPPPPLYLLNQFREDGKDAMKFYTDPSYFVALWVQEMQKDTEQQKEKYHRRKKKKPRSPDKKNQKHIIEPKSRKDQWERQKHGKELIPQNAGRAVSSVYDEGSPSPNPYSSACGSTLQSGSSSQSRYRTQEYRSTYSSSNQRQASQDSSNTSSSTATGRSSLPATGGAPELQSLPNNYPHDVPSHYETGQLALASSAVAAPTGPAHQQHNTAAATHIQHQQQHLLQMQYSEPGLGVSDLLTITEEQGYDSNRTPKRQMSVPYQQPSMSAIAAANGSLPYIHQNGSLVSANEYDIISSGSHTHHYPVDIASGVGYAPPGEFSNAHLANTGNYADISISAGHSMPGGDLPYGFNPSTATAVAELQAAASGLLISSPHSLNSDILNRHDQLAQQHQNKTPDERMSNLQTLPDHHTGSHAHQHDVASYNLAVSAAAASNGSGGYLRDHLNSSASPARSSTGSRDSLPPPPPPPLGSAVDYSTAAYQQQIAVSMERGNSQGPYGELYQHYPHTDELNGLPPPPPQSHADANSVQANSQVEPPPMLGVPSPPPPPAASVDHTALNGAHRQYHHDRDSSSASSAVTEIDCRAATLTAESIKQAQMIDSRSELLLAIRQGIQLRKVDQLTAHNQQKPKTQPQTVQQLNLNRTSKSPVQRPNTVSRTTLPGNSLAATNKPVYLDVQSIMDKAFEMRRKVLEASDSEGESEGGADGWSSDEN